MIDGSWEYLGVTGSIWKYEYKKNNKISSNERHFVLKLFIVEVQKVSEVSRCGLKGSRGHRFIMGLFYTPLQSSPVHYPQSTNYSSE